MDRQIISAICGTIPGAIIHIQIEKDGQVRFGAYGNFYPESIYLGGAVDESVIQSLVSQNIMRPYTERRPRREIKS